jgi:hypothetical protein
MYPSTTALLWVYAVHIMINAFGLIFLTWILSQYRYSLLTFYSSIISLVFSSITVFWIYTSFSTSSQILFLFMWLAATVYFVVTFFHFWIGWLYVKLYMFSWADPLGDVLHKVEAEEKSLEDLAEKSLFSKK